MVHGEARQSKGCAFRAGRVAGAVQHFLHLPDPSSPDRPVGSECTDGGRDKKKPRRSEREMTTPLFMLRCVQLGISIRDLELLTIGLVNDMFSESVRDEKKFATLASQDDMDKF